MKIAQLAPLWESVPPKTYGGTELVVHLLCEDLIKNGHEVTLYACGGSNTSAKLESAINMPMREACVELPFYYEINAISRLMEQSDEFDIIHNHMGFQFFPFANVIATPIVTTLHGAFCHKEETSIINSHRNLNFISISNSQREGAPYLNYVSTVYNGIDIDSYEFNPEPNNQEPYLAFLGRISEEKGTHIAINMAKETGHKLIIAGKIGSTDIGYYEEKVKPLIDNEQIVYIGELSHFPKVEFLKNALATLHTVTWPEPFGLVMAESMACGTPVLALKDGSIPEVIKDGVTGFVENEPDALTERIADIEKIDRKSCRKHVEDNFSCKRMTDGYINAYKKVIDSHLLKSQMGFGGYERFNLQENA